MITLLDVDNMLLSLGKIVSNFGKGRHVKCEQMNVCLKKLDKAQAIITLHVPKF